MPDFQHVNNGDPLRIRAGDFNSMQDAAKAFRNRQHDARGGPFEDVKQHGIVRVQNTTADLRRWQILDIFEPLIMPLSVDPDAADPYQAFQNILMFKGRAPIAPTPLGRFAVAIEPIAKGRIGRCVIHGMTQARINSRVSDAAVTTKQNSLFAQGEPAGAAEIVWQEKDEEGSEGEQRERWAIIHLGKIVPLAWIEPTEFTLASSDRGNRWKYTGVLLEPATDGSFARVDPVRTIENIYSGDENRNQATGVQGNSVDLDESVSECTVEMLPIRGFPSLACTPVRRNEAGEMIWQVKSYENAVKVLE